MYKAPLQYKKQVYAFSGDTTTLPNGQALISLVNATNRNRISIQLSEPISCKDDEEILVSIVDAEIMRTASWTQSPMFVYVCSTNIRTTNANGQIKGNSILAKIPINAPSGYIVQYFNLNDYNSPTYGRLISNIDLALLAPDGSDISFGSGNDWAITIQFNIVKLNPDHK